MVPALYLFLATPEPMKLRARAAPLRCALCHDDLDQASFFCGGCGVRLHTDCRESLTRCPTLGCVPRVHVRRIAPWSRADDLLSDLVFYGLLPIIASLAIWTVALWVIC
jgi:hypothetical protein